MCYSFTFLRPHFIYLLLFFILSKTPAAAQEAIEKMPDTVSQQVPQKDLVDVARALFRIKPTPPKSDSSIVKPVFTVVPAVGYTLQSRLIGTISGNVVFRTAPQSKLSAIAASMAYSQNKQFTVPIESSIWSKNNRYNFVGELRFFRYPQSTFGLGSASSIKAEDPMVYDFFRLYEVALRKLAGNFYAGAGYIFDYHWNISHQNTGDYSPGSYEAYGTESSTISSGFTINALYDSRRNSVHPENGAYAALRYQVNQQFLGSTNNWHSVLIEARKYYHFPAQSRNVLALWSYNWLVLGGKPPFLDLPATAWDAFGNTGRGYIQGRFRGTKMVYGETEYRFLLSQNGLVGGVVFANVQSFAAGPGTGLQKAQPGYGLGLRLKLNKVSKTNLSIDYGFGTQGSHGLFINIGEMF